MNVFVTEFIIRYGFSSPSPYSLSLSHSSSFSFAISSARGAEEEDAAQLRSVAVAALSSVHAMILLFSWLAVDPILGCGKSSRISFRFASSLFGGVRGGRGGGGGGGGGELTW